MENNERQERFKDFLQKRAEENEKRLKEKQKIQEKFRDILQKRFEERERELQEKQRKILANLQKKHENLRKSIRDEKERELAEKERELKVKLSKRELREFAEKLRREFENKKIHIERECRSNLAGEKAKLRKHFGEEILAQRIALNNRMHEQLTQEIRKLHSEHDRKLKDKEKRIEEIKQRLKNEKTLLDKIKNKVSVEAMKIKKDEEGYKNDLRDRLEAEKKEAVKRAIEQRSHALRRELKEQFNQRLKLEMKAKEAEFEKRKADLTLEIQKKAKHLFG